MKRIVAVLLLSAVGLTACAAPSSPSAPEATGQPATEDAGSLTAPSCEDLSPGTDYSGRRTSPILRGGSGRVSAFANIFAAGRDAPPAPGGGGAGVLPPAVVLPEGPSRVVTFPRVTGRVQGNPHSGQAANGPDGDRLGPTDVKSLQGIAGIQHRTNNMFLVGVFLTDVLPSNPAPPRLDFSAFELSGSQAVWVTDGEEFGELVPEIGQTFFIGDGKGRRYVVPAEATRLFLGFADAMFYQGCPGWYANNSGHLTVTVKVTQG